MKPTRIFVDAHQFDHGFEGAASFIHGLYLELVRQRPAEYKIYLGCANPAKVVSNFAHDEHFEVVEYGSSNRFRRLALDIPATIARIRPDLAHFQYFTPIFKSCPWIVTIHDVLFNDFPQYFPKGYGLVRNVLFPISARRADLLTTVSHYSKERISAWYQIDPARIKVIPNGVNSDSVQDDSLAPAKSDVTQLIASPDGFFLCVSRFEPRKNQAAVLEAFVAGGFWKQGIQLIFVGSRTLSTQDFNAAYASIPAQARKFVHVLEGLSFPDLQRLYANAIAAIYPSFAEGFGMPPLEAAAAGTPSLCAHNTAMRDFTPLAPYFFNATDRSAICHLLRNVVDHREKHRRQAAAIAAQIKTQFSWCVAASEFGRQLDRQTKRSNGIQQKY